MLSLPCDQQARPHSQCEPFHFIACRRDDGPVCVAGLEGRPVGPGAGGRPGRPPERLRRETAAGTGLQRQEGSLPSCDTPHPEFSPRSCASPGAPASRRAAELSLGTPPSLQPRGAKACARLGSCPVSRARACRVQHRRLPPCKLPGKPSHQGGRALSAKVSC